MQHISFEYARKADKDLARKLKNRHDTRAAEIVQKVKSRSKNYLCLALPCLALPCLALPCLALPCLALPCLALPCLALPCLATSFYALPFLVVFCSVHNHSLLPVCPMNCCLEP